MFFFISNQDALGAGNYESRNILSFKIILFDIVLFWEVASVLETGYFIKKYGTSSDSCLPAKAGYSVLNPDRVPNPCQGLRP